MMEVSVKCHCCSELYTIKVKEEDYKEYVSPFRRRLTQEIFPYLKPSERELLISRTCDSCFHEMFGQES